MASKKISTRRRPGRPSVDFSARAHILEGASTAFGEKGYADTVVEDICMSANVSRATFYRFFKNKEEVLLQLFDVATVMLFGGVRAAVRNAESGLAKIDAGVTAYISLQSGMAPLSREFLLEAMRPHSPIAPRYRESTSRFAGLVTEEFRLVRNQEIDPFLIEALMAAMERALFLLGTETSGRPEDLDRCKRVILRIIIGTLAEDEPVPPIPLATP